MKFIFWYPENEFEFTLDDACALVGKSNITFSPRGGDNLSGTIIFDRPFNEKVIFQKSELVGNALYMLNFQKWKLAKLKYQVVIENLDEIDFESREYAQDFLVNNLGLFGYPVGNDLLFSNERATKVQLKKAIQQRDLQEKEDESNVFLVEI